MKFKHLCITLALACSAAAVTAAPADDSLYLALGGGPGIASLTTDLVARLKADPRIGSFFKDTKPKHLADQLRDQFCELAGGPCKLDSDGMRATHEDLKIHAADFNRLVEVLQQTMDDHGIAFSTQNRLLALLAPMHREIVAR